MTERRFSRNGDFTVDHLLAIRQKLVDWGIPEDLLIDPKDQEKLKELARKQLPPLDSDYVIHPGTRQAIRIPEEKTCRRNLDGTAVHIEPDGAPIFYQKDDSK